MTTPSTRVGGQPIARRAFLAAAAASTLAVGFGAPAFAGRPRHPEPVRSLGPHHATDRVRTLYDVVLAEGLTPPAAARFYYYTALAMYAAVEPAMPRHRPLTGQLSRFPRLPLPHGQFDAPTALSAAVSTVAIGLLPTSTPESIERIGDDARSVVAARSAVVGAREVDRSRRYGERVAAALLRWMSADGYADTTQPYDPPVGPSLWRPTPPNFGTAIEPHWHLVRPALLRRADEVVPRAHVPFSSEVGSPFHEQAMATYRQSALNTDDQVAIARFWTDNPRLSGLPSGHWFLIMAQVADVPLGLGLDRTLEGFVRLGAALHDAFLNCWTWKYRFNLLRPVTYVRDYVDSSWNTLVNSPQFPEYTSGHSVGSGAAEVVLTRMFGSFSFLDSTGVDRGLAPRSFASFTHAAEEAAISRLYGGIHYPMAIENGIEQGRRIGRLVDKRLHTGTRR